MLVLLSCLQVISQDLFPAPLELTPQSITETIQIPNKSFIPPSYLNWLAAMNFKLELPYKVLTHSSVGEALRFRSKLLGLKKLILASSEYFERLWEILDDPMDSSDALKTFQDLKENN
jgi:hypothetical protein